MNVEELLSKHSSYQKDPNLSLIRKACEFAEAAHLGEKRPSGEDFIQHPLRVADLLCDLKVDSATVAAALLHDVLEHTDLEASELTTEFGEEVSFLVQSLTAVTKVPYELVEHADIENLRKLILAMAKDYRVLLIRLSEKLDNLKTVEFLPEDQRRQSLESVFTIWAPLADLLGVWYFRWQLEDLAFKNLQPQVYEEIERKLEETRGERERRAEESAVSLREVLQREGIKGEVHKRVKNIYGFYLKLPRYEEKGLYGHDVVGLRALVDELADCYKVLDLVRSKIEGWRPVEGEGFFDDYISRPKPNGYQSLHVVVLAGGKPLEIQIRTYEMHERAEYGMAAHAHYREKYQEGGSLITPAEKIDLIQNILGWQKEKNFNLFPDQIFVLTPKGDVIDLPKGATSIDFAFAVHTQVGKTTSGARVGGKMVPLNYELKTGEVVEITTSPSAKPSRNWLEFVKTEEARSGIKKALKI